VVYDAARPEGTRNFTYDAEGNIKTDGTLSFEFALHGRMRSVNSPAGKTTYWYNALGQRVRKTGQDTTYYFYDGEGRLLGEYDRNGNVIQETVYLDNMPVVVLKQEQGSTVPYYIYADHINTPRVITKASDNAMVWRWDNADPFGAVAPDASLTGAFAYNPRFPGQLFDAESGLHQNYFRDYDPKTGRYVTSDPIGLDGGVNTYGYVLGNPVSYTDPKGLAVPLVIPFVCAAGGCEAIFVAASATAIWWANKHPITHSGNSSQESSTTKTCPPGPNDPCEEIRRKIRDTRAQLNKREMQLNQDQYNLFNRAYSVNPSGDLAGKGTYVGHLDMISSIRKGLAKMEAQAIAMGCL
jgi:RHS repeat-associated protein